jgi:hypothetical protein
MEEVEKAANKAGSNSSKSIEESGQKITGVFKNMLGSALGFASAYVGISTIKDVLGSATAAFGDQQSSVVLLNTAMKDTGQKWTPVLDSALATTENNMLKFGNTSATTANALQMLILRGVPAKDAMGDLGEIANIAAAQHTTLTSAVTEVTKAASGKMSPALKELGATNLPKGVTGVKALNDILGQVKDHVAGAADAVSNTMPGALASLGASVTDKVMVPLGAMVDKGLNGLANWVSQHGTQISAVLSGSMNVIGAAFNWVAKNVMPIVMGALGDLGRWISQNQPLIRGIADTISNVLGFAFKVVSVEWQIYIAVISRVLGTLGTVIGSVINAVKWLAS